MSEKMAYRSVLADIRVQTLTIRRELLRLGEFADAAIQAPNDPEGVSALRTWLVTANRSSM